MDLRELFVSRQHASVQRERESDVQALPVALPVAQPWQEKQSTERERADCVFQGVFGRFGAGIEKSLFTQRSEHLKLQSQASSC